MFCDTISNSKRETFRQCRLKYKYNYVNRFEETDQGNTGALHFGSFIHEVFEKGVACSSLNCLLDLAKDIRDKYKFPDKYNKDIEKCFKNFLRFNASLPKDSLVEHHFSEEIANGIKHEGFIDRIIKAPTGSVLVIDYKTSRREKTKFELFNDPQGKSYVYAAHKLLGVPITKITFAHYYPLTNNLVPATYTESTIRQHIKSVVDDVWTIRKCKKDDLYPTKNDFCNWCSYKSICPLYNDPEVVKGRLDECKTRPRRKK
jgi:RecB family exonuclease